MRYAVLAPPEIPIPVKGYAGIELITQNFAEEMSKGHDVTLYCNQAESGIHKGISMYPSDLSVLAKYDYTFDFTHQKSAAGYFAKENYVATAFLTDALSNINDVFPTKAVRDGFHSDGPVIYPGIKNVYQYTDAKADYLLYLGRISKFKRPDIAVQVANRLGKRITVAGHVGAFSKFPDPTYDSVVKHMCKSRGHEFVENPTLEQKVEMLRHAQALIVPSDWSMINSQESFGIVCVEALLSGTPIIVSGDGGLKEIVTQECGYVCRTLEEYVEAVKRIEHGAIEPRKCLERGEYFTSPRMVADYLALSSLQQTTQSRSA